MCCVLFKNLCFPQSHDNILCFLLEALLMYLSHLDLWSIQIDLCVWCEVGISVSESLLWFLSFMLETFFRGLVTLGYLHMLKHEEFKNLFRKSVCGGRKCQLWTPLEVHVETCTLVPSVFPFVLNKLPLENSFSLQFGDWSPLPWLLVFQKSGEGRTGGPSSHPAYVHLANQVW